MNNKMKYLAIALFAVGTLGLTSCNDDEPDTSFSVIKDSQTPENDLDRWLMKNFVKPYNIEMKYRWEDNEISMDYILVPARYEAAIRMATVLKYICFDSFDKVTGSQKFIHDHFPKHIQLVGNPGWNTNGGWMASGSYTLGSSEGGYKINLWYANHLVETYYDENWMSHDVITSRAELNKVYFHTILHEFGHVFHQKSAYTNEFNQVNGTSYLGGKWTSTFTSETDPEIYARGFVTAYSSYGADEDFAEIFSTYVCSTDKEWKAIFDKAGTAGKLKLETKFRIVKEYFQKNWNLDIDALHNEIQEREANLENVNFDDISL